MTRATLTITLVLYGIVMVLPTDLANAVSKQPADPIADLRTAIQKDVAEPARAEAMSKAVDDLAKAIADVATLKARQRDALTPLLLDYGVTRDVVEAKLAELAVQKAELTRRLLDAHVAFKAAATPAEWKKLQKLEEAALQSAVQKALSQQPATPKEK
jgi:hypothetical protein